MSGVPQLAAKWTAGIQRLPVKRIDLVLAVITTLVSLMVFAFVGLGQSARASFAFIRNVEWRSVDARFIVRGPRKPDPRIVIVGMDEKTLQKVGAYPIPRNAYAQFIDQARRGGASIIAFDVAFPLPEKNSAVESLKRLENELSRTASAGVIDKIRVMERTSDNDAIFADSLKRAGNVILGHLFLDAKLARSQDEKATEDYFNVLWGAVFPQVRPARGAGKFDLGEAWANKGGGVVAWGVEPNIRLLAEAAKSYGFFDFNPDEDGTVRRSNLLIRYRDRDFYPSLALETVRKYEDIKDQAIEAVIGPNGMERIELGPHNIRTEVNGTVIINFAGPFQTYPHFSMADVIDGTVPPETFKEKIVFLGATAKATGDLRSIPFQKQNQGYMGVELHANVIDNLLHDQDQKRGFLRRGFREEMIDLFFIILFGLGFGYWFGKSKPLYATFSVIGGLAAYAMIVYYAFSQFGMLLSVVIPAGTLFIDYAAITSYRMVFEEYEKRRVRKTFARYVSPGVIALIEKDPKKYFKQGGESKELTVMFSDIRSFTTISEGLTPDELVALLNEYLGEMTDILFEHWGTLDKYIGDAIMAFWGSPFPQADHAIRACAAALDMRARLEELNLKWAIEGRKQLAIGIGINTGQVNVGNMGSSKRFAWTVMGDNVNLASRLEGLTKEYHIQAVIAEGTYRQAKDHYVFREVDKIRVKGKLLPVNIYQLMDRAQNADKYSDLLVRWSDAISSYRRQEWREAIEKFETLLRKYPQDGPGQVFLQRSLEFRNSAPADDWDGVYVMKTK